MLPKPKYAYIYGIVFSLPSCNTNFELCIFNESTNLKPKIFCRSSKVILNETMSGRETITWDNTDINCVINQQNCAKWLPYTFVYNLCRCNPMWWLLNYMKRPGVWCPQEILSCRQLGKLPPAWEASSLYISVLTYAR